MLTDFTTQAFDPCADPNENPNRCEILPFIAAAVGVASVATSIYGAKKQRDASKAGARAAIEESKYNISAADKQIENLRETQDLDALRLGLNEEQIAYEKERLAVDKKVTGLELALANQQRLLADNARNRAHFERSKATLDRLKAAQSRRKAALDMDKAAFELAKKDLDFANAELSTFQSKVAKFEIENVLKNVEVQESFAQDAIARGEVAVEGISLQARQKRGEQVAEAASRGVQVGSGSAQDLTEGTDFIERREAAIKRREAEVTAFQHRVNAMNLKAQIPGLVGRSIAASVQADAHRLTASGRDLTAADLRASARDRELSAQGFEQDAVGRGFAAAELEAQAKGRELAARGHEIRAEQQTVLGRQSDIRVKEREYERATIEHRIRARDREIVDLTERKDLFEKQGRLGARAQTLQGQATLVTALGNTAANAYNLYKSGAFDAFSS